MHTLSTRATNIPAPLPDDPTKTTMKKAYYLACGFCRWTSRDISKLIEYYQQLAHREKQERDRKKLAKRRQYAVCACFKHPIWVHIVSDVLCFLTSLKEGEDQKEITIEPAQALDEVEPLPEDCYTRPVSLPEAGLPTCRSLSAAPQTQTPPDEALAALQGQYSSGITWVSNGLVYFHSVFLNCSPQKCEHNLSKPEFNPTSIKFKIQLVAVIVAFRKSNKIGFFIKVIPQKEEDTDVTVSFRMRHDFRNLAAPIRPSEEGGDAAPEAIWLTHHVELRLGPLAP
ncbi:hypothetical protein GOODEAATRI_001022 [Goodea atripinnis]|uniref:Dynactin subunit 4 n=1 Tax=Goodea atripinnis TaxID=208336 RepID=A0ABV0P286_9TELE